MRAARIVATAALVVLAACSGGVSKEDFIEQADQACREAQERTRDFEVPRTPRGVRDFVNEARDITAQLLADLRELEIPEGDRDTVELILARMEQVTDLLPDLARATIKRDTDRIASLGQRVSEVASEANELARDFGLQVCGRDDPAFVP